MWKASDTYPIRRLFLNPSPNFGNSSIGWAVGFLTHNGDLERFTLRETSGGSVAAALYPIQNDADANRLDASASRANPFPNDLGCVLVAAIVLEGIRRKVSVCNGAQLSSCVRVGASGRTVEGSRTSCRGLSPTSSSVTK